MAKHIHIVGLFVTSLGALVACNVDVDEDTLVIHGAAAAEAASEASCTDACPQDTLCLSTVVKTAEAIPRGRLAVVWFQLGETSPEPEPEIGYDVPFDPAASRVRIPLSALTHPKDEGLSFCERECTDTAKCPCTSDVRVETAQVVVARDVNADGRLDTSEVRTESYGRGYFVLGSSGVRVDRVPKTFEGTFSSGIPQGTSTFRFIADAQRDGGGNLVRIESSGSMRTESPTLYLCARPATGKLEDECRPPWPEVGSRPAGI